METLIIAASTREMQFKNKTGKEEIKKRKKKMKMQEEGGRGKS